MYQGHMTTPTHTPTGYYAGNGEKHGNTIGSKNEKILYTKQHTRNWQYLW